MLNAILPHKKLSQIIFEWQAEDRAALLALFMMLEITWHWLWCLFVWSQQAQYGTYVQMALLPPVWIGVSLIWLLCLWLMVYFVKIRNNLPLLYRWQLALIAGYSIYIAAVILVMGHSSLVTGVSLVGGAMLGMMLVRRRYMWWAFLWQVAVIVTVTFIPYLGVKLPDLRQLTLTSIPLDTYNYLTYSEMTTIENAIAASIFKDGKLSWESIEQLRQSSSFFWRSSHLYLALPKAIFMVYVFRKLLVILDDSKNEILEHANKDELTKLNSRRFGLAMMQKSLMALKEKQNYSVIILDLDYFKNINDTYGHDTGDLVLREVGALLNQTFELDETVSRQGGEEFLIGLPHVSQTAARAIAEDLRLRIAEHSICLGDGRKLPISASLGLYTVNHDDLLALKQSYQFETQTLPLQTTDASSQTMTALNKKPCLIHRLSKALTQQRQLPSLIKTEPPADVICQRIISIADSALYHAKESGRNRVASANELIEIGKIKF